MGDIEACDLEDVVERVARLAHGRVERAGEQAVRAWAIGRDRARLGGVGNEHTLRRADQREAGRRRRTAAVSVRARAVEHHDLGARRQLGEGVGDVGEFQRFDRNIEIFADLRVDRREIVVAAVLCAVARKIKKRNVSGPADCTRLKKSPTTAPMSACLTS